MKVYAIVEYYYDGGANSWDTIMEPLYLDEVEALVEMDAYVEAENAKHKGYERRHGGSETCYSIREFDVKSSETK